MVDLGCGMGFLSLEAARMVGPEGLVIAVDASSGALEALVQRGGERGLENLRPLEADISRLPLEDEIADTVVARSILSYVDDRKAVLREARRVLKPGGVLSIFEPVLSEEELVMDWGDEVYLWIKFQQILERNHPAYSFSRHELVEEFEGAGYDSVDSFTWHANVTRPFADEREAMDELRDGLPGELSLAACWHEHGASGEEMVRVARQLASESTKPSYRDILPCIYIWGVKPAGDA